jgi:hypothetical protein
MPRTVMIFTCADAHLSEAEQNEEEELPPEMLGFTGGHSWKELLSIRGYPWESTLASEACLDSNLFLG